MKKLRVSFKKISPSKQQEEIIEYGSKQLQELAQKGFMIELLKRA